MGLTRVSLKQVAVNVDSLAALKGTVRTLNGWSLVPLVRVFDCLGLAYNLLDGPVSVAQHQLNTVKMHGIYDYLASIDLGHFVTEAELAFELNHRGAELLADSERMAWDPPYGTLYFLGNNTRAEKVLCQPIFPLESVARLLRSTASALLQEIILESYVMPFWVALAQIPLGERLAQGEQVNLTESSSIAVANLAAWFGVLKDVGMAETSADGVKVRLTEYGQARWQARHALGVPWSYLQHFKILELLLRGQGNVHCDRGHNVTGSGNTHGPIFALAEAVIAATQAKFIVDIGCGDGAFLAWALKVREAQGKTLQPVGVDFETVPLQITSQRVPGAQVFRGNIKDPDQIAKDLRARGLDPADGIYFTNFIAHEVTGETFGMRPDTLFEAHCRHLGMGHGNVFAEVYQLPWQVIARQGRYERSTNPPYGLVHTLSGQGMLKESDWLKAFKGAGFSRTDYKPMRPINRGEDPLYHAHGMLFGFTR